MSEIRASAGAPAGPRLLALPLAPAVALDRIILPALALLPASMDSVPARVMLLTIALQESALRTRVQDGGGPARGLWQFERGGGVVGVLRHPASREYAAQACARADVTASVDAVYCALAEDDVLACTLARLLLWTDPRALPGTGFPMSAWALYLRIWRPGRPHPEKWSDNHAAAVAAVCA